MSKSEMEETMAKLSREEVISALFANLIVQQTNMALMFLGKVPHPETGETIRELESAKFFIDQIEMLEVKTKGNLTKQEEQLLQQSLTALRMAFVEAVEHPVSEAQKKTKPKSDGEPHIQTPGENPEDKKKFSKTY